MLFVKFHISIPFKRCCVFAARVWFRDVGATDGNLVVFLCLDDGIHLGIVLSELVEDFCLGLVNFHTYKVVESVDDCKKNFQLFFAH